MPRRGFVPKREVLPDPVYGTTVVTKLINQIMLDGKRGVAQNVCYQAFEAIAEKTGKAATDVFQEALNNVAPQLEVKARRVGGATYQVPIEIRRSDWSSDVCSSDLITSSAGLWIPPVWPSGCRRVPCMARSARRSKSYAADAV